MKIPSLVLLAGFLTFAQGQPAPSVSFPERLGNPEPNLNLPPQVIAEPGKLTLFADYGHQGENWMPLYLVNRTNAPRTLTNEDGDVYIKLEMRNSSGEWERVQPHYYSFCGNSYGDLTLPPGMYCRIRGYRPTAGTAAKVRYSSYSPLTFTSNVGDGFYTTQDLAWSRIDRMSLRGVPGSIRDAFNLESPGGNQMRDYHDVSKRVAALRMASLMGEIPAVRVGARQWVAELRATTNPSDAQRLALPIVEEILKSDWGERVGTRRLLEQCFAAVKLENDTPPEFGTLEKESGLAWTVIHEIAELLTAPNEESAPGSPREPLLPIWREIMALAARHVLAAPMNASGFKGPLLGIQPLADEFLPDDVFASLLTNCEYYVVWNSAQTLIRRNQWDKLADQVAKISLRNQGIVFQAAIRGVELYKPMGMRSSPRPREIEQGSEEQLFWAKAGKTNPLEVSSSLFTILSRDGEMRYNSQRRENFEELFEYWRKEIERSDQQTSDFNVSAQGSDQEASIAFISSWKNDADIPLLTSLLRYKGYSLLPSVNGGPNSETRVLKMKFIVRQAAAKALEKMGKPVPEDLTFESEVKSDGAKEEK